jgi:hypothetical protein
LSWRVAEPDEALTSPPARIRRPRAPARDGRIVPAVALRRARCDEGTDPLLEAHESEIAVPCVSQQKIRVDLRGVVIVRSATTPLDRERRAPLPDRPA